MFKDTIVALASPLGHGALHLIRVSGAESYAIAQSLFSPSSSRVTKLLPRRAYYGHILDPKTQVSIDDVVLTFFQGPNSFTGEDGFEISCHGSPYVAQKIIQCIKGKGARLALPGEFSQRAYLAGKIDLTAAEGINEMIKAVSEQQWQAAKVLKDGVLNQRVTTLRAQLIHALSYLEAQIDFPEEKDTGHLRMGHVRDEVIATLELINTLLDTYATGEIATGGLKVSLIGPPNAGKSTLLNILLGRERALVSAQPGTTRDYLEESCLVEGRLLRLLDTAGLRQTADLIEAQGIERALKIAAEAHLVVALLPADGTKVEIDHFLSMLAVLPPQKLVVLTKTDLGTPSWLGDFPVHLKISSADASSLALLRRTLVEQVDQALEKMPQNDALITNVRQKHALEEARDYLRKFLADVDGQQDYPECLAHDLQSACRSLEEVIGRVSGDDILERIFSEFCIGK